MPAEPAAIRSEPRPFTVGTVAVVSTRKGSDLFVDAASRLLRRATASATGSRWSALRTKWSSASWALDVLREARERRDRPHPADRVFERLRSWDAFVLPSRSDPFPISMLEAMASGLPVVGTRRDGIAEQIAAGTGLLIEPEDPGALADAIAWCADQPAETRARMGTAARGRVAEALTLEHQAAAHARGVRATLATARAR